MKNKLLIISLFFSLASYSQIAASRPVAGTASTSNAATYAMTAFTPANNSLLVVFVSATGTNTAAPTMTGGSLTWTRELIQIIGANEQAIFWAKVGTGVSTTITFDCTGDNATGAVLSVVQFTGHDATTLNPIKQSKPSTATTTSTNANITFDAALSTANGYAAAWTGALAANTSTPPTGWTEADDIAYATPAQNMSTAYRAGGVTTAGPFTFTNASTAWAVMGVEVYVSGAGPQHKTGSMMNAF